MNDWHEFNEQGHRRVPVWLWLIWIFSAKGWIIFVMAGASRQQGSDLLTLFYPDHNALYLAMVMGTPALLWMWLAGVRDRYIWSHWCWKQGRWLMVLMYFGELFRQSWHVWQTQGAFAWPMALSLLCCLWGLLYLCRSRQVAQLFEV
jgi:hypothetical protein